jgi:hypothetical protein
MRALAIGRFVRLFLTKPDNSFCAFVDKATKATSNAINFMYDFTSKTLHNYFLLMVFRVSTNTENIVEDKQMDEIRTWNSIRTERGNAKSKQMNLHLLTNINGDSINI